MRLNTIVLFALATFLTTLLAIPNESQAFCGFYVAKADASLFNDASRVVMVRLGDRTVITMENDYIGELREFAMVIPVPTVLQEDKIRVREVELIERVDNYSAPRLVEYFDEDPCTMRYSQAVMVVADRNVMVRNDQVGTSRSATEYGVTIDAEYKVEEYDILILSARESDGLVRWLNDNDYKIPEGAHDVLGSYIKQDMRFFVAKVDLDRAGQNVKDAEKQTLRPLQIEFTSEKFMLPIRLGTVNARGDQDLLVYCLTEHGRVETANYRTVKLPTDKEIPVYIKNEFAAFYRDLFSHQHKIQGGAVVFNEYTWNSAWCDPCADNPLTSAELSLLGYPQTKAGPMLTRLHLRYNSSTFPEDLMFTETRDKKNYQGRYILQHPWKGSPDECTHAVQYFEELETRQEIRVHNLADLTGRPIWEIRQKAGLGEAKPQQKQWYHEVLQVFGMGD